MDRAAQQRVALHHRRVSGRPVIGTLQLPVVLIGARSGRGELIRLLFWIDTRWPRTLWFRWHGSVEWRLKLRQHRSATLPWQSVPGCWLSAGADATAAACEGSQCGCGQGLSIWVYGSGCAGLDGATLFSRHDPPQREHRSAAASDAPLRLGGGPPGPGDGHAVGMGADPPLLKAMPPAAAGEGLSARSTTAPPVRARAGKGPGNHQAAGAGRCVERSA